MKKYYTLDSMNALFPFCKVQMGNYTPKQPDQAAFLNQMYPEGLSKHGHNYLYNPGPVMESDDCEGRALLTACQQLSEVKQFRELLADQCCDDKIRTASIYEVITEGAVHCGDMNLLNNNCPVLELYRRAHLYWSGEPEPLEEGEKPFWELLIPLPVLIGQRIPE